MNMHFMKQIYTVLICLLISLAGFSQPTITETLIPQYISVQDMETPFAFRLTINGLMPGATYRYYNRFSDGFSFGEGSCTLVSSSGVFTRVASPAMSTSGAYGEFIADANGKYTGWFIGEPEYFGYSFFQGAVMFVRIYLNDGAGASYDEYILTVDNEPITVLGTDATVPGSGTGIRSTPAANGVAKNFVMLYDNIEGAGRPVAGTFIESDGNANDVSNGYTEFYQASVDNVAKAWGTFIPNDLPGGIKKIVQYSLTDGTVAGSRESASGEWAKEGGGRVSTVNPDGGITNVIALNGNAVTLGSAPGKIDQTITFNLASPKQYGHADFNPGATAGSQLEVTYTSSNPAVATIVNGQVHIVGAGSTDITAKQSGDEDFNAAPDVTQTLTVNKVPLTIKADDKQMVSGDPFPVWTATYTGFVNEDDPSALNPQPQFQPAAQQNSPAGTYAIAVSGAGSPNYDITYEPGTLTMTVNKQPQTISFGVIAPKVYGVADFAPGAINSSGLPPQYRSSNPAVAIIVNNAIHITGTGVAVITASHPGNVNFEPAADVTQTLTVNKAPLTIKADDKTKLTGHANPPLTITYTGFVYGENSSILITQPSISTTATTASVPGEYEIMATGATAANYAITHVNGTLTVQPLAVQTITFPELAVKKYGDAPFPAGAAASSGLPVSYSSSNPAVATVVDGEIRIHSAGVTVITAVQPGDASNEPAPDAARTLTVNKTLLTIRANDQSKLEGQANPALALSYSGFANNEDESVLTTLPVVATTATSTSVVGTYPLTVSGATAANYSILELPGILTVQPVQNGHNTVAAFCNGPGQLQVNVYADTTQKAVVQLFDPSGNRLLNAAVSLSKGANTFHFPTGNVTSGVYFVRVVAREFTRKEKVWIR